ncbi:MAG: hypothetical protein JRN35_10065 [Nitrososphaerota archaeon]|nr:hypothetical protein [Nitrososphaerota archaeon]
MVTRASNSKGEVPPDEGASTEPSTITPSLLLATARALASRLDREAGAVVQLAAIPMRGSSATNYGGYLYIQLRDPSVSNVTISGKLPDNLQGKVEWDQETVFSGVVEYEARRGGIEPQFRIGSIKGLGAARRLNKEDLRTKWKAEIERPKVDPEVALAGPKPMIGIVAPSTGVALQDIRAQLLEGEPEVDLQVREASMTTPEAVVQAVRETALNVDLLVLTRGGGQGLDDLDTDALIQAVVQSPVPTVVAVGHAIDNLVLEDVACKSFPTPTAFGAWLHAALGRKRAKALDEAKAKEVKEQGGLAKTNAELVTANQKLTETVKALTQDADARSKAQAQVMADNRSLTAMVTTLSQDVVAKSQEMSRMQAQMVQLSAVQPSADVERLRTTVFWLKVGVAGLSVGLGITVVLLALGV